LKEVANAFVVVVSLSVKHLGKVFAQEIAQKPKPKPDAPDVCCDYE
jgi:hypothetical protein